jgi:hypothetical protein
MSLIFILVLVLKGVATRVRTYSVVLDEIWYTDLQYKLVEYNSGVGGRTVSVLCACESSFLCRSVLKNGTLDRPWIALIIIIMIMRIIIIHPFYRPRRPLRESRGKALLCF